MLWVVFLDLCLQEHSPASHKQGFVVTGDPQMAAPGQGDVKGQGRVLWLLWALLFSVETQDSPGLWGPDLSRALSFCFLS